MGIRVFINKRLEIARLKDRESWNYTVKSKIFPLLVFLLSGMAFALGTIFAVTMDCWGDISSEVSDKPVEFTLLSFAAFISISLISYFVYYLQLKEIVKSYESRYGSTEIGDKRYNKKHPELRFSK